MILNEDLWQTLAQVLKVDRVTVLTTDEDVRAAEREQWDDGTNFLAGAPGVIWVTTATSPRTPCCARTVLKSSSIEGSELGRGRGGPHSMTCPSNRESVV